MVFRLAPIRPINASAACGAASTMPCLRARGVGGAAVLFPIAYGCHGHAPRGGLAGLGEFGFGADWLGVRSGRALGGVAFGIGDGVGRFAGRCSAPLPTPSPSRKRAGDWLGLSGGRCAKRSRGRGGLVSPTPLPLFLLIRRSRCVRRRADQAAIDMPHPLLRPA